MTVIRIVSRARSRVGGWNPRAVRSPALRVPMGFRDVITAFDPRAEKLYRIFDSHN
jgi:hypothetical protein